MGYRVSVITLSDKGAKGERKDESGPLIQKMVTAAGYEVVGYRILSDDREALTKELVEICDARKADLILTTGGTGFSARDMAPEATMDAIERNVPGIAEAMRMHGLQYTNRSMLSRAASGIRKETLIVNLPGSPRAVKENLEYILPVLKHGLEILTGNASECAR